MVLSSSKNYMNYLIIGASKGIGKAIADKLREQNHTVYTAQRNEEASLNSTLFQNFDALSSELKIDMLPA